MNNIGEIKCIEMTLFAISERETIIKNYEQGGFYVLL